VGLVVKMLKCEVCGKLYPEGTVCCGVGVRNEMDTRDSSEDVNMSR